MLGEPDAVTKNEKDEILIYENVETDLQMREVLSLRLVVTILMTQMEIIHQVDCILYS